MAEIGSPKKSRKKKESGEIPEVVFSPDRYLRDVLARCVESPDGSVALRDLLTKESKEKQMEVVREAIAKKWVEERKKGRSSCLVVSENGRAEHARTLPAKKKLGLVDANLSAMAQHIEQCVKEEYAFLTDLNRQMKLISEADMNASFYQLENKAKELLDDFKKQISRASLFIALRECVEKTFHSFEGDLNDRTSLMESVKEKVASREAAHDAFIVDMRNRIQDLVWLAAQCENPSVFVSGQLEMKAGAPTPEPKTQAPPPEPKTQAPPPEPKTQAPPPEPKTKALPPEPKMQPSPPEPKTQPSPPESKTQPSPPESKTKPSPPEPKTKALPPEPKTKALPPEPKIQIPKPISPVFPEEMKPVVEEKKTEKKSEPLPPRQEERQVALTEERIEQELEKAYRRITEKNPYLAFPELPEIYYEALPYLPGLTVPRYLDALKRLREREKVVFSHINDSDGAKEKAFAIPSLSGVIYYVKWR